MINYFLLLDKNLTTDQKVVSSNPAECAIKNPSLAEGWRKENNLPDYFLTTGADLLFCEQGSAAKQNLQIK